MNFTPKKLSHFFTIFDSRMLQSKNSIKSNKNVKTIEQSSSTSITPSAEFPKILNFYKNL